MSSGSIGSHRAFMGVAFTLCVCLGLTLFVGWRWYFDSIASRKALVSLAQKAETRARELENLGLTVDAAAAEPAPVSVLPKIASPAPAVSNPPAAGTPSAPVGAPEARRESPVPAISSIKELPLNESGEDMTAALATLDEFWKAQTIEDRKPLVFDLPRVAPLMKDFYENQKGTDPVPGSMAAKARYEIDGTEILYFSYASNRPTGSLEVAMRRGPDGKFLIDWESVTGYGELSFQAFRETRPVKPVRLRAYVRLFEYYNFEFSDSSRYLCVKLTSENGESSLYAYTERGTDLCRWLETDLSGTGPTGFRGYTLMVSFPPDAQSNQCVRLEQVITPRWLVLP